MNHHFAWRPRLFAEPIFNPFASSPDRTPRPDDLVIDDDAETASDAAEVVESAADSNKGPADR